MDPYVKRGRSFLAMQFFCGRVACTAHVAKLLLVIMFLAAAAAVVVVSFVF
jgi:hypothetical protein